MKLIIINFFGKKNFFGQCSSFFLNTNRIGFVEFWKIIPDFAQEKGIVIKL